MSASAFFEASTIPPLGWVIIAAGSISVVAGAIAMYLLYKKFKASSSEDGYEEMGKHSFFSNTLPRLCVALLVLGALMVILPPVLTLAYHPAVGRAGLARGTSVRIFSVHEEVTDNWDALEATYSTKTRVIDSSGVEKIVPVVGDVSKIAGKPGEGFATVTHAGKLRVDSFEPEPFSARRSGGAKSFGVYVVKFSGSKPCGTRSSGQACTDVCSLSDLKSIYYSGTPNLKDYYNKVTDRAVQFDIKSANFFEVTVPGPVNDKDDIKALVTTAAASKGYKLPSDFDHTSFWMSDNWKRDPDFAAGAKGVAQINGALSWMITCGNAGMSTNAFQVLTHEVGHNKGLRHAGAWDTDKKEFQQYFDLSSIMSLAYTFNGKGLSNRGLSAYDLNKLGALGSRLITLQEGKQDITLRSLTDLEQVSSTTKVAARHGDYWISWREKEKYDADLNSALSNTAPSGQLTGTILVHKANVDSKGSTQILAILKEGEEWSKDGLKVVAGSNGKATVTAPGGSSTSGNSGSPSTRKPTPRPTPRPSSGSSSSKKKKGCFSAFSRVKTLRKGVKPIAELKVGDKVASWHGDEFSPVIAMVHGDQQTTASTLQLTLMAPKGRVKVSLTEEHLVATHPEGKLVEAGSLQIGDLVILEDGQPAALLSVENRKEDRIVNPITMNGYIVVEGVRFSVHSVDHDKMQKAMAPLRAIYRLAPSLLDTAFVRKAVFLFDKYVTPMLEGNN